MIRQFSSVKGFLISCYQVIASIFFLHRYGDERFPLSGFPFVIKSGSANNLTKVEFLYGKNMAFRRDVIAEFKSDKNLNIHGCCFGDDNEIAYRISRIYQNIYIPFAKLIHNQSPIRASRYAKARLVIINRHYSFKRNLPQDFKIMMVTKGDSNGVRGLMSGTQEVLKNNKKYSDNNYKGGY